MIKNIVKLIGNKLKQNPRKINLYSNVIQRDTMGYPLRLVIMDDGEQIWIDSYDREGDVELVWSGVKMEVEDEL